jgi:predicted component of type VI protein secretion system
MTTEELQREIDRLCLAVIHEQDPAKLTKQVAELNQVLERRERQDNGGACQSSDARTA